MLRPRDQGIECLFATRHSDYTHTYDAQTGDLRFGIFEGKRFRRVPLEIEIPNNMPVGNFTKRQYKLVEDRNDGLGKVPAFDEEAFQLGITFKAKYVGTLEITRPSCRAEIVTAMRKVRYEFKIKGIEKRRVNITISVDGIKVTVRKRRRRMRKERLLDEEPVVLHEHQIGRIFYVSHDSMDLKIFSYITKDNFDNQFRCSVFKAYRKSKALFVVRTIGQAFEVCHRLQQESGEKKKNEEDGKPVEEGVLAATETDIDAVDQEKTTDDAPTAALVTDIDKTVDVKPTQTLVEISQLLPPLGSDGKTQPFTVEQLRMLFNQQLEHYIQETEVFKAENQLLKDQLILEKNARIQAQEREQCLLQKNRELLQTVQTLANRLQTVNPGDDSLSSAFDTSNRGTIFNPGYPNMYSTPHKKDDFHQQLIGGNSVVIPAIPPPPDATTNFETDLSIDPTRMAPLATVENSMDNIQSTVGLYWKTFDEDDIITPGNAFDDSTSESSDDDPFSESFTDQGNVPSEKTNGWDNAKLNNGNDVQNISCGKMLTGASDTKIHQHNNGVLYNGLQALPTRSGNNNIFNTNAVSSDVRTAIQTDF